MSDEALQRAAAALALLRTLVTSEDAGVDKSGVYHRCIYCDALSYEGHDLDHLTDCPITKAREMVRVAA